MLFLISRLGSPGSQLSTLSKVFPLVLSLLFVSGCNQETAQTRNIRSMPDSYVPGSFVVTVESTQSKDDLTEVTEEIADKLICEVKTPEQIKWGDTSGVLSEEMKNTYNVKFADCDFSKNGTAEILASLSSFSGVVSAEVESVASVKPLFSENDPYKKYQGHLGFIKRDEACELIEKNDETVVVAVVDSGVDVDHPDLVDSFYRDVTGRIVGANFVGSGARMPPDRNFDDQNSHGTHVAGLVAATSGNSTGVVGVASCANVKIMPIRVLGKNGSGTSVEIERGIKWAADHGADVINLSLGFLSGVYGDSSFRRSLYDALAAQDVIVFAAAGNDGFENGTRGTDGRTKYNFPSSYNNVISVAATNNEGRLTSFSNYGTRVDIAAPGDQLASTIPGSYKRMSGTSMASPVAAGAYALALASIRAKSTVKRVDSEQVNRSLNDSILGSVRLSTGSVLSGGALDLELLVSSLNEQFGEEQPPVEPTPVQPTPPEEEEEEEIQPNPTPVPTPVPTPDPTPVPEEEFSFFGIRDGQRAGWPQRIAVTNLPENTYAVHFYWGNSRYGFTKVYVPRNSSSDTFAVKTRYFLFGTKTLTAIAADRYGRVLSRTSVMLRGY